MLAVVPQVRTWYTHVHPPFVLDVKIPYSLLTSMESYWVDTTGRRRDGCKIVCHLIMNSIHLLTSQTSTIFLGGVPGPRAIGKELLLHLPWARAFLPLYVSLYITQKSLLSLAYCI